jgi:prophage antirepressor-like protein
MEIISKTFKENSKIRIILIHGKEWFVAKDVAKILDYKDTDQAIRQHCKKAQSFETVNLTGANFSSKARTIKIIPESDVWRLIIKSRLPEAEKIEEWIFEEVLPQIRKTGSYSIEKKAETEKLTPQKSLEILQTGNALLSEFKKLENPLEKIQLDNFHKNETGESNLHKFGIHFKNTYFLPTELGKMTGQSGAEINLILEKKGFQFRDENGVWKPTEIGKEFCLQIGNAYNQLKWRLETISTNDY